MLNQKSRDESFENIYRKYYYEVYRISLYYTKHEYEAQDIAQKVFSKLYQHFDEINPECIKAYAFRAARNLSYNWLRDTKMESEGEQIEYVPEERFTIPGAEDDYLRSEKEFEITQFFSVVMHHLQEENEMWYEILNMVYCLEMSHDAVAKALGISKSVLYSKLYRAKQWVRKHYEEQYKKVVR